MRLADAATERSGRPDHPIAAGEVPAIASIRMVRSSVLLIGLDRAAAVDVEIRRAGAAPAGVAEGDKHLRAPAVPVASRSRSLSKLAEKSRLTVAPERADTSASIPPFFGQ
jgi:hypothetical protein